MPETSSSDTVVVSPTGIRFPVASRPQRRFSNVQTVNNLAGAVPLQPIQLPATGFVRKISIYFCQTWTGTVGILAGADAPWNLVDSITLTDATGQPITQPISGYNLYLVNKYFGTGTVKTNNPRACNNPHVGPEYTYTVAGGALTASAIFRLDIDLERDVNSGYCCVPNLDSNASLQLRMTVNQVTNAFTGATATAAEMSVRVEQHYWAPVASTLAGQPVNTQPVGFGDFVETRIETGTATAAANNLLTLTNRGGMIQGIVLVSRAAGARVAFTAASDVGLLLDNMPLDEGIPLESHQDMVRRTYGHIGADIGVAAGAYAPLGAGTYPGLDDGVMVWPFSGLSGGRETWLNTRVGTQLQVRVTPGAAATQTEVVTLIGQIRDGDTFYATSALD